MSRGGRPRAHDPRQRTCVGCRTARPKAELARLVVASDGLVVDRHQHLPGRGAYVCTNSTCATRAARQLAKALRSGSLDVDGASLWALVSGQAGPARFDPDAAPAWTAPDDEGGT
jgi:predicted RNA-binding protein YlxR (DUF448 family)